MSDTQTEARAIFAGVAWGLDSDERAELETRIATTLSSLRQEIATKDAELEEAKLLVEPDYWNLHSELRHVRAQLAEANRKIAEQNKALEPFARAVANFDGESDEMLASGSDIRVIHLRTARRAREQAVTERKFAIGDRVTKVKGSSWTGHIVGFYSTALTPVGYAVESETETGSVQIYPEAAQQEQER